jgi:hypothetical protein
MAFRILSVIQVRTTLGWRPLSIYTILARLRCVLSGSRRCHWAETEHNRLDRRLGNAREEDHATTARAAISRYACTVRIRIVRAAGCPILVEKPFGGILEHSFHCNAERLVLRLRQRFERLSRLAGDYCDGRSAVPKRPPRRYCRPREITPTGPRSRRRASSLLPPSTRPARLRAHGQGQQEKQSRNYLFSHGWILPPADIGYKASLPVLHDRSRAERPSQQGHSISRTAR